MLGKVHSFVADRCKADSPLEKQLKEATNNDTWNVSNRELQNIAFATFDNCDVVIQFLWQVLNLNGKAKNWRRVLKALTLVVALLMHGSNQAIEVIRTELWRIAKWKEHRVQEGERDVGGGIREKASCIVDLCNDPAQLQRERDKAQDLLQRVQGIGTGPKQSKHVLKSPFGPWRKHDKMEHRSEGVETDESNGCHPRKLAISQFCHITNAPQSTAQDWLERCNYDLNEAINRYQESKTPTTHTVQGIDLKTRCEYVQSAMRVSEQAAMELLRRTNGNTEAAINLRMKELDEKSDSTAESESSDEEDDDVDAVEDGKTKSGYPQGMNLPSSSWQHSAAWGEQKPRSFAGCPGNDGWSGPCGSSTSLSANANNQAGWPPWSQSAHAQTGCGNAFGPSQKPNPFGSMHSSSVPDMAGDAQNSTRYRPQQQFEPWPPTATGPKPYQSNTSAFQPTAMRPNIGRPFSGSASPASMSASVPASPRAEPANPFGENLGRRCMGGSQSGSVSSNPFTAGDRPSHFERDHAFGQVSNIWDTRGGCVPNSRGPWGCGGMQNAPWPSESRNVSQNGYFGHPGNSSQENTYMGMSPPPFQSSAPLPFQSSAPPPFPSSALPPFQSSAPPLFQSSAPPPFQSSAYPPFQSSASSSRPFGGPGNHGFQPGTNPRPSLDSYGATHW